MNDVLRLVASLTFHQLDQVTSFISGSTGKAYMQTSGQLDIPFAKGALSYNCASSPTSGGTLWTVGISGNLKQSVPDLGPGVLVIELESGERLLIGEPELPVAINISESFLQRSLQISHKSWHKPYFIGI